MRMTRDTSTSTIVIPARATRSSLERMIPYTSRAGNEVAVNQGVEISRCKRLPRQNAWALQSAALLQAVAGDLVEEGAKTDAQSGRGFPSIPSRGGERGGDRLSLGGVHRFTERGGFGRTGSRCSGTIHARAHARVKVIGSQEVVIAQHPRPFDSVLELPGIPGPALGREPGDRRGTQRERAPQPPGGPGGKVVRQRWDVLGALAERGQVNRHHVDPVEEVLAELPRGHIGGQVAGGSGEEPGVDFPVALISHPPDLPSCNARRSFDCN